MQFSKKKPQIVGLITPEVFDGENFIYKDEINLCDALEIRYDLFDNPENWKDYASKVRNEFPGKEIIGTIRLEADGGAFPDYLSDKRNILLFELMLLGEWNWVDLEYEQRRFMAELTKGCKKSGCAILMSHHNFKTSYAHGHFKKIALEMIASGANGLKFAVMAQNDADLHEIYTFISQNRASDNPLPIMSAFSMGEHGRSSREVAPTMGAPYTYGYFGDKEPVSGQISVKKLYNKFNKLA
jgi:3-dehydroquinate dehydratase I